MTDAELEALRPAHVSMGAMKAWRATRAGMRYSVLAIMGGIVGGFVFGTMGWIAAVGLAGLMFCMAAWVVVLVACFSQYSLRSLMLYVLVTAGLVSAMVAVPEEWILLPLVPGIVWWFVLWITVGKMEPRLGRPSDAELDEAEPASPEPRA
ncbi:MAG: hypothetical protein L6R28_11475 [Planctomycetes bacterium]|nr:hypothetical protein [Planctomycetota bacterium]